MIRRGIVALLLIVGCRSRYVPHADTVQIRASMPMRSPSGPTPGYQNENVRRAALARGPVPGYAGEMAQGCDHLVLLTDTLDQAAAARKYIGNIPVRCTRPGKLLFRQVRYDFAQLYAWYSGAFRAVWREKGVASWGISVQHNRIEVGVIPEAKARVQQLLDSLSIPKDAVGIVRAVYACVGGAGPSVVVNVWDPRGRPAAFGTTIVIQDGAFRDSVDGTRPFSDLAVGAGNRRPGVYQVRLHKPGYKPVVLDSVKAPGDSSCRYAEPSDIRDVTLELLPNPPPVRSIVVLPPAMSFGLPNLTVQMRAIVDADSGLSTAVRWSSGDTTVATLSPSGVLTSQCRKVTGEATITATSVADGRVRGTASVTVEGMRYGAPCPQSR